MRLLCSILACALLTQPASAALEKAAEHVKGICSQTIEVTDGLYGKEYYVLPTRMSSLGDRLVTALDVHADGKSLIKLSVLSEGQVKEHLLPQFSYKRILLTEESVWFLSEDSMKEFNLMEGRITGTFPTFPKKFDLHLTTRARGFTYHKGYIYIAHGELGVSVFDAKNKKHFTVIKSGMQKSSLAGAVQIQGNFLYILQGAYLPDGFNGIAIVNLHYGTAKTIAYDPKSGVVDPYSSTMLLTDKYLVVNNSGWIHGFSIPSLHNGKSPQAPAWLAISEKIEASGGNFDHFLMIQGDMAIVENHVLACSSVSYVPKNGRRPVKEWRLINKAL